VNNLSAVIYGQNRTGIEEAYAAYLTDKVSGESRLFQLLFAFALNKINNKVFDKGDGEHTAEDHAQDVTIYVWQHLGDFEGEPSTFYSWLHRICFRQAWKALNQYKASAKKFAPLLVEDEDGSGAMEDNPLIYQRRNTLKPIPARKIPDYVQGKDRIAAEWIGEGMSYKFIAKSMGTTVKAVEMRVAKIRKRVMAENAKSKKA
jgi:RNA polymerase sigma factor (sigma-70 family)